MKRILFKLLLFAGVSVLLLALLASSAVADPLGTAFTYQGRLNDGGSPANGSYDITFTLHDAATGNGVIAGPLTNNAVSMTNGLFTVSLDFGGGVFTGNALWLELGVRTNGSNSFTTLSPRQPILPTPYALYASNSATALTAGSAATVVNGVVTTGTYANPAWISSLAGTKISGNIGGNAVGFSGSLVGDVTGTQGATVVSSVGGQSAANVAAGASAANTATSANTANTIVKRDASGNFSAGTITANLSGNAATATTASTLAIPPGMALIPAGSFTMGDTLDGLTDAVPVSVTVSAFYMDVNLESYSQWQSVYFWATNQGYGFRNLDAGRAANNPVQSVDWYDCVKWCNARSQQAGKTPVYYTDAGLTQVYTNGETDAVYVNWTPKGYRLPTEAEWEKAARGGLSGLRFPWGNIISENLANYYGLTASYTFDLGPNGYNVAFTNGVQPYTSPAGYFAPNGYGLYDMVGNLAEWCWDWYGTPYAGGSDPRGPTSGTVRVIRGTGWNISAGYGRTAHRADLGPAGINSNVGFRTVLIP